MRKYKKVLAFTLAALQILMLLPTAGFSVYAEELEAVTESAESDVVEGADEDSGVLDSEEDAEELTDSEDSGVLTFEEDVEVLAEDSEVSDDSVEETPAEEPAEEIVAEDSEVSNASVEETPVEEDAEELAEKAPEDISAEDSEVSDDPVEEAPVEGADEEPEEETPENVPVDEEAGVLEESSEEAPDEEAESVDLSEEPEEDDVVFYTLKVVDTYSDTGVSDVRYEEQLPAGQGYSFSALEVDNYVVDGDAEYQGELTEDTTLEFVYLREYTVTFYDIVAEEVISEVTVKAGEAAVAPEVPEYEGFEFIGWSEDFSEVFADMIVEAQYKALGVSLFSEGTVLSNTYASAILYEDEKKLVVTGMFKSGTGESNYPWYGKVSGYTVEFTDDVTFIGANAFYSSGIIGDLVIPDSITSIGKYAFYQCQGFKGNLTLGKSLQTIENYAFSGCTGFAGELIIPDSVTSIGDNAFEACESLTGDLIIPDFVTALGSSAFSNCSGFDGVLKISNSLTSIKSSTFMYCTNLKGDLIIPDLVTSIGMTAFENCQSMGKKLVLGKSVKSISSRAFNLCPNISAIYDESLQSKITIPANSKVFYVSLLSKTPTEVYSDKSGLLSYNWTVDNRTVSYVVSFNTNGGTPVELQLLKSGEYAVKPEEPKKSGYRFLGWKLSDDADDYFDFESTPITGYTVLYAQWEEKTTCTVEFNTNGGTPVDSQEVIRGNHVKEPEAPIKEGCEFKYWYKEGEYGKAFSFSTPIEEDTILHAMWYDPSRTFTVTFETNGGTPVASQQVVCGSFPTYPGWSASTKAGYDFKYWTLDEEGLYEYRFGASGFEIDRDTILYAYWYNNSGIGTDAEYCTVTFDSMGGSYVAPKQVKRGGYLGYNLGTPVREGYYFMGWYRMKNPYNPDMTYGLAYDPIYEDMTVYAWWISKDTQFNIKVYDNFYGEDGMLEHSDLRVDENVYTGDSICYSPLEVDGYKCTDVWDWEWSAVWSDANHTFNYVKVTSENPCLIEFMANSATYAIKEAQETTSIDGNMRTGIVTPPAINPEKEGYVFKGWQAEGWKEYKLVDGVKQEYEEDELIDFSNYYVDMSRNSYTLYAKFKKTPMFTVTFESNGGTPVDSQQVKLGDCATKPENPTKEGCVFVNWYLDAGLSYVYNFNSSLGQISEDTTLYAKWRPEDTCKVTFNTQGGSKVDPVEIPYNKTFNDMGLTLETPVREGYEFAGWYTVASPSSLSYNKFALTTKITSDRTVYAVWIDLNAVYTVQVYDEYYNADGVLDHSDLRLEQSLPAGESYSFSCLSVDNYTVNYEGRNYSGIILKDLVITFKYYPSGQRYLEFYVDDEFYALRPANEISRYLYTTTPPEEDPEKEGYIFKGWTTANRYDYKMVNDVKVLYKRGDIIDFDNYVSDLSFSAGESNGIHAVFEKIPVDDFLITVIDEYYDVDGTTLLSSETRLSEELPKDSAYSYEALSTMGYKVLGQSSYTGTVTEEMTIVFKYAEDPSVLGGTLVISIPAEMSLAYDANLGDYVKTDSVYASGRCGMKKRLDVETPQHITFVNNDDNSVVIENAQVTFGAAVSEDSTKEYWSATELREGISSPVGKSISVSVDKKAVDFLGSYSSIITYNISLVEDQND